MWFEIYLRKIASNTLQKVEGNARGVCSSILRELATFGIGTILVRFQRSRKDDEDNIK